MWKAGWLHGKEANCGLTGLQTTDLPHTGFVTSGGLFQLSESHLSNGIIIGVDKAEKKMK